MSVYAYAYTHIYTYNSDKASARGKLAIYVCVHILIQTRTHKIQVRPPLEENWDEEMIAPTTKAVCTRTYSYTHNLYTLIHIHTHTYNSGEASSRGKLGRGSDCAYYQSCVHTNILIYTQFIHTYTHTHAHIQFR
jgi:hypothetical protein